MLKERPRLGFLGLGWIGRHRLQAIHDSGLSEIAGLADVSAASLDAARAIAPDAYAAASLDELLALDLDGVVIATPSAQHFSETSRALARGCAVFCQKPLGRNREEAASLVGLARRQDVLLAVDLSYRGLDGVRRVDTLVQNGELGRIFALDLTFHNAYGPDKPWYFDRSRSGGGCLMDLGIHLLDRWLAWVGTETSVATSSLFTNGERWEPGTESVEDFASVQLRDSNGCVGRLTCSWGARAGCDAEIEFRVFGTDAGARVRNVGGSFYDFVAERLDRRGSVTLAEPPDPWGGKTAVDWVTALGNGARFSREAERFVDLAGLIDRCYASAEPAVGSRSLSSSAAL
jgi:predicted dehydrogenase